MKKIVIVEKEGKETRKRNVKPNVESIVVSGEQTKKTSHVM